MRSGCYKPRKQRLSSQRTNPLPAKFDLPAYFFPGHTEAKVAQGVSSDERRRGTLGLSEESATVRGGGMTKRKIDKGKPATLQPPLDVGEMEQGSFAD